MQKYRRRWLIDLSPPKSKKSNVLLTLLVTYCCKLQAGPRVKVPWITMPAEFKKYGSGSKTLNCRLQLPPPPIWPWTFLHIFSLPRMSSQSCSCTQQSVRANEMWKMNFWWNYGKVFSQVRRANERLFIFSLFHLSWFSDTWCCLDSWVAPMFCLKFTLKTSFAPKYSKLFFWK